MYNSCIIQFLRERLFQCQVMRCRFYAISSVIVRNRIICNFQCQVTKFKFYASFSVKLRNSNSRQVSVSSYEIQNTFVYNLFLRRLTSTNMIFGALLSWDGGNPFPSVVLSFLFLEDNTASAARKASLSGSSGDLVLSNLPSTSRRRSSFAVFSNFLSMLSWPRKADENVR